MSSLYCSCLYVLDVVKEGVFSPNFDLSFSFFEKETHMSNWSCSFYFRVKFMHTPVSSAYETDPNRFLVTTQFSPNFLYTTPLSTLISSLCLDHHLYADYTQLFFSLHKLNFDSSISQLQNAFQQISSWMTANVWLLIFLLLTPLRLNFCSSNSKSNLPK